MAPDQVIFMDGSVMKTEAGDRDEAPDDDAGAAGGAAPAGRQLVGAAIYVPGKTPADLGIPEGAGYAEAFQDGDAASR